jgi:hypothetical protein
VPIPESHSGSVLPSGQIAIVPGEPVILWPGHLFRVNRVDAIDSDREEAFAERVDE